MAEGRSNTPGRFALISHQHRDATGIDWIKARRVSSCAAYLPYLPLGPPPKWWETLRISIIFTHSFNGRRIELILYFWMNANIPYCGTVRLQAYRTVVYCTVASIPYYGALYGRRFVWEMFCSLCTFFIVDCDELLQKRNYRFYKIVVQKLWRSIARWFLNTVHFSLVEVYGTWTDRNCTLLPFCTLFAIKFRCSLL